MIDTPDTSPEIEYGDRVKINRPKSGDFHNVHGIYTGSNEEGDFVIEIGWKHMIAVPPEQVELVAKREEQ